jgi:hypothetical protein
MSGFSSMESVRPLFRQEGPDEFMHYLLCEDGVDGVSDSGVAIEFRGTPSAAAAIQYAS